MTQLGLPSWQSAWTTGSSPVVTRKERSAGAIPYAGHARGLTRASMLNHRLYSRLMT
jgi:hypothetical protein